VCGQQYCHTDPEIQNKWFSLKLAHLPYGQGAVLTLNKIFYERFCEASNQITLVGVNNWHKSARVPTGCWSFNKELPFPS
jgi:hypothetical protein